MKNVIASALLFTSIFSLKSQSVIDTIDMEPGYAKQVFYQLRTGAKHSSALTQWHMAHTMVPMDNAIRLNHVAGVFAYQYPYGDNSSYDQFDTTGWQTWVKPHNQMKDEKLGALNQSKDMSNMWDFSWGVYDPSTHLIVGDSLYLFTVGNGVNMKFYKFMPIKQDKNGDLIFKYGPIDEIGGTVDTLKNSLADGGMFKYYNFSTDAQVSIEPSKGDWHLNFTRYFDLLPAPGTGVLTWYPTMGVESKRNVSIAHVNGVDFPTLMSNAASFIETALADTSIQAGHGFNMGLTRVGADWKFFNGTSFVVTPKTNFIAAVSSDIGTEYWGFRFITFEGQASGKITLEKVKLGELARMKTAQDLKMVVFPNPAQEQLFVSSNAQEILKVNIWGLNGQLLMSQVAESKIVELSLNTLQAGQFIIEAVTANGSQRTLFLKK